MKRPKFTAVIKVNRPVGTSIRIHQITEASPQEQMEMLNKAIVGYDEHHVDAPGEDLKFRGPSG